MVASIGKIASPSQGVSYFDKDGYCRAFVHAILECP